MLHGLKLQYKEKVQTIKHLKKEIEKEQEKPKFDTDKNKIKRLTVMIKYVSESKRKLNNKIKSIKEERK